ncbi:hypothetical protein ACFC01_18030 [Streptomyces mirabilis]|uniref:hypothetical protein n=1 Tax=Streptomyces mirabilis TaxID=68239 RepID=UPI0035DDFFA7
MTAAPGPDERRARHILRSHGVGPDAYGDTMATDDDWWDKIYDEPEPKADPDNEEPAAEEDTPTGPGRFTPQPDYWPRPHLPDALTHVPARAALSPKTRAALYNASAAGAGWGLGLYHQVAASIADCGTRYSTSGALTLGIGSCLLIAHVWDRRTRHWQPAALAWAARIPLATTILALALWAPRA